MKSSEYIKTSDDVFVIFMRSVFFWSICFNQTAVGPPVTINCCFHGNRLYASLEQEGRRTARRERRKRGHEITKRGGQAMKNELQRKRQWERKDKECWPESLWSSDASQHFENSQFSMLETFVRDPAVSHLRSNCTVAGLDLKTSGTLR